MGPIDRYLGKYVPDEELIWQDPVPKPDHPLIDAGDIADLKTKILGSGIPQADLIRVAWASASTFRGSDKRGGANGARIRLQPMKDWDVNEPEMLSGVLSKLEAIKAEFDGAASGGKKVSLADLIVLGGNAAVEAAAKAAGHDVEVPFNPGRGDASQEQTEVHSVEFLKPIADGFRNYTAAEYTVTPAELLIDKAQQLTLTAPEMTVLVGGMRSLDANFKGSKDGVWTDRPGVLSNDFFKALMDMTVVWEKVDGTEHSYVAKDRNTGSVKWTGSQVDLVFGSNSQLRALSEVYATDEAETTFVKSFVKAWGKVMELDRYDVK